MIPLKDTVFRRLFPLMTWTIICLNAAVFFLELHIPSQDLNEFMLAFGIVPAKYAGAGSLALVDYLDVITSMFIHGGWLHIIGNMWFFYLFGGSVEDRMGHWRFLIFYILCGISAAVIYIFFDPVRYSFHRGIRCHRGGHGSLYFDVS